MIPKFLCSSTCWLASNSFLSTSRSNSLLSLRGRLPSVLMYLPLKIWGYLEFYLTKLLVRWFMPPPFLMLVLTLFMLDGILLLITLFFFSSRLMIFIRRSFVVDTYFSRLLTSFDLVICSCLALLNSLDFVAMLDLYWTIFWRSFKAASFLRSCYMLSSFLDLATSSFFFSIIISLCLMSIWYSSVFF